MIYIHITAHTCRHTSMQPVSLRHVELASGANEADGHSPEGAPSMCLRFAMLLTLLETSVAFVCFLCETVKHIEIKPFSHPGSPFIPVSLQWIRGQCWGIKHVYLAAGLTFIVLL